MPRAIWSGSLSFGLVNVPVQLVSAVRDLDYHFHQLHKKDKARIEQRRYCKEEDVEVVWEEVAHGYELKRGGKEVIVTDEELASVQPRKTRTIDIEAFVDLAEIDPIYFDHPYFLVPVGESEGTLRAYGLLVDAMGSQDRVALGRVVLRTKEYLVAVQVRDGALALTTMLFHDEVRPTGDIPTGGKKPSKRALGDALAIIEELSTEWDPGELHRLLPGAAAEGHRAQAQGEHDRGSRGGEGAHPGPRPDGGARADARERPRRPADPGGRPPRTASWRSSPARSSTSAPRRPGSAGAPRCPRTSWWKPSPATADAVALAGHRTRELVPAARARPPRGRAGGRAPASPGCLSALLLQREGLEVAVIDQHRVGTGVTGHTTAKLSSLHQLVYAEFAERFGHGGRPRLRGGQRGRARAHRRASPRSSGSTATSAAARTTPTRPRPTTSRRSRPRWRPPQRPAWTPPS